MSCNYADGLSAYDDKGVLGVPEKFDTEDELNKKCAILYNMIKNAKHVVVHTGAGISTSAGIPDFRGPNGVWTLEKKGLKPNINISFCDAKPTVTHMALCKLVQMGMVKYIVSQNIDGLHLKSGIERQHLAELHGNMFLEKCSACQRQFIRGKPVETVGQKSLGVRCRALRSSGNATCRGTLHDLILDWEHNLPNDDLSIADMNSCIADLSICFGTTLQIIPSGTLPTYTLKNGGKLVIVNLQPTKHDRKATLVINSYVDDVMKMLMKKLNYDIPNYSDSCDPTKCVPGQEWSIPPRVMTDIKLKYKESLKNKNSKRQMNLQKRKFKSKDENMEKKTKIEMLQDNVSSDARHDANVTKTEQNTKINIITKNELSETDETVAPVTIRSNEIEAAFKSNDTNSVTTIIACSGLDRNEMKENVQEKGENDVAQVNDTNFSAKTNNDSYCGIAQDDKTAIHRLGNETSCSLNNSKGLAVSKSKCSLKELSSITLNESVIDNDQSPCNIVITAGDSIKCVS